eukprot:255354_1
MFKLILLLECFIFCSIVISTTLMHQKYPQTLPQKMDKICATTTKDNIVYIFGGRNDTTYRTNQHLNYANNVYKWDGTLSSFIQLNNTHRIHCTAQSVVSFNDTNNDVIIAFIGAHDWDHAQGDQHGHAIYFNTKTETFESNYTVEMASPTVSGCAVYNEMYNKIYYVGGYIGGHANVAQKIFQVYDVNTNTWNADLSPPPVAIYGSGCVIRDRKLYTFGGHDGEYTNKTMVYDMDTNSWTILDTDSDLSYSRLGIRTIYDKKYDYVVLFGGYQKEGGYVKNTEIFSFKNNKMYHMGDMVVSGYVGAVKINNHLYTLGGINSSILLDDIYQYDLSNDLTKQTPVVRDVSNRRDTFSAPVTEMINGLDGNEGHYHDIDSFIGNIPNGAFDILPILNKWVEYKPKKTTFQQYIDYIQRIQDMMRNGQTTYMMDRDEVRETKLEQNYDPNISEFDQLDRVFADCDWNDDGQLNYNELVNCFEYPLNWYKNKIFI